jgi:Fe-S-cluster containining protein
VTEGAELAFWTGSLAPLAIARPLVPITRFALPPEIGQPSVEVLRYVQDIAQGARELVRELLLQTSAGGGVGAILSAIDTINTRVASAYEDQLAHHRRADVEFGSRAAKIECRKGCSFCCHLNVTSTVLEAVQIAAAIRAGSRANLEQAVLAASDAHADLDPASRLALKSACPLLVLGACSIYEARPLACRALMSQSARACERHFNSPGNAAAPAPTLVTPRLIASGFITGEIAAMRDLGLAAHLVELTAALAALLRDPTILVRWLAGEDVFTPV